MTATVNLRALSACTGGRHRHVQITIGALNRVFVVHGDVFSAPITEADWENLTILLLRLMQLGRTFPQLDALISAPTGVDTVIA